MKKLAVFFVMASFACSGMAVAQSHNGRFKGKIDNHEFDLPVQCDFASIGKATWITAGTDANPHSPQEDTNGDGIAGQINASVGGSSNNVGVHIRFGNDEYKFGGMKTVVFREQGFSWKTSIEHYDSQKRQALLEAGKSLRELAPERAYEVDIDLDCQ